MKVVLPPALVSATLICVIACGQDEEAKPKAESEWKLAAVTLKFQGLMKGLVKDEPGEPLYLDKGSGPVRLARSLVLKVEDLPEEEAAAVAADIAKRREQIAKRREEKRAQAEAAREVPKGGSGMRSGQTKSGVDALGRRMVSLSVGTGTLVVSPSFPSADLLYMGAKGPFSASRAFLSCQYREGDADGQYDTEGFFNVSGKPEKIDFSSDDPAVLRCHSSFVIPVEAGTANAVVSLAGRSVRIPFRVVRLPVSIGDSPETVINTVGLPDFKRRISVRWPESEQVDNVLYSPSVDDGFATGEHWEYKRFPGAVLVIRDQKLANISTTEPRTDWDDLSTKLKKEGKRLQEMLEEMRGPLDRR